jgi:hypothetical protein
VTCDSSAIASSSPALMTSPSCSSIGRCTRSCGSPRPPAPHPPRAPILTPPRGTPRFAARGRRSQPIRQTLSYRRRNKPWGMPQSELGSAPTVGCAPVHPSEFEEGSWRGGKQGRVSTVGAQTTTLAGDPVRLSHGVHVGHPSFVRAWWAGACPGEKIWRHSSRTQGGQRGGRSVTLEELKLRAKRVQPCRVDLTVEDMWLHCWACLNRLSWCYSR